MRTAIIEAILRRADYRCAWCACDLRNVPIDNYGNETPVATICYLDPRETSSSMVASCRDCVGAYARWWLPGQTYSVAGAKRWLGRCPRTGSGPFVDYLEAKTKGRGYLLPFNTALARIEAQRNVPLDLRRKVA